MVVMRRCLVLALVALAAPLALAEAPGKVEAWVEHTTVPVDARFLLTVRATGTTVEEPILPKVEGLEIRETPVQNFESLQLSMGRMSVTRERGYIVHATRTGKITVPGIGVSVNGSVLYSQPIVLTVTEESPVSLPAPPGQPASTQLPSPQGPAMPDRLSWQDVLFTTSEVENKEVYEGEPVRLTLSVWSLEHDRIETGTMPGRDLQYPSTEGFYVLMRDARVTQMTRNDLAYRVTQYPLVLYPTRTGTLMIGSWHWEGRARALTRFGFQTRDCSLDTPPIPILVKALPPRPPEFSGAVGKFTVSAHVTREEILQGIPIQLVVRVTGQGNPDAIGDPIVPRIEECFISDPEKATQPVSGPLEVMVEKSYTYSITPMKAGDLTIPEVQLCYFDPEEAVYKTGRAGPFVIHVLPSVESQPRVVVSQEDVGGPAKVDVLAEDVLPVITSPGRLRPTHDAPWVTPAILFAPVAAYGGLAGLMGRRRRLDSDTRLARAHYARSKGRKRLYRALQAKDPAQEVYRAVAGFIADKFDLAEAGMTSDDAARLFERRQMEDEWVQNLLKILRACEHARYAGGQLAPDELRALAEAAAVGMDRIEDALRKGRRS
jgi:hypothetical protein